jgi:hypothetical protein
MQAIFWKLQSNWRGSLCCKRCPHSWCKWYLIDIWQYLFPVTERKTIVFFYLFQHQNLHLMYSFWRSWHLYLQIHIFIILFTENPEISCAERDFWGWSNKALGQQGVVGLMWCCSFCPWQVTFDINVHYTIIYYWNYGFQFILQFIYNIWISIRRSFTIELLCPSLVLN